jgi:starch synthase
MYEAMTPRHGEGLEGLSRALHARGRLGAVLNGIDADTWNPMTDPAVKVPFSIDAPAGKAVAKAQLQQRFGLPERPEVPLFAVLARLTEQKGYDDVIAAIEHTVARGLPAQFAIHGQGEGRLISGSRKGERISTVLHELAKAHPDRVSFVEGFEERREHELIAGSDFWLMPSGTLDEELPPYTEPCGLPQMYALRYLTVPVVRAVGGLDETIEDWQPGAKKGNGFKFTTGIGPTIDRALAWYGSKERTPLLQNCAASDFSWQSSAAIEQAAWLRHLVNRKRFRADGGER